MQLFLQQIVYFCSVVSTDHKSVTYFPFIFNTSNENSGGNNRDVSVHEFYPLKALITLEHVNTTEW